jgi:hypothetical protein
VELTMTALYLLLGTVFGWILSRSGAADYDFVQRMFLFESVQLYGIIGAAVALTAPGLRLLKRVGRTAFGAPLRVTAKPRHPGNVLGGILFGVGWSMTGMCPGPILVNLGEGKVYALGALAGVLVGAGAFSISYQRVAAAFRLPALRLGTGDG